MCQPTLLSALVKEAAVTGDDFDAAEEALRNFNRRIEETRGFDPDQWLPSELIDCAIVSLLDAPALRVASALSRGWRRRVQADAEHDKPLHTVHLIHAIHNDGLLRITSVACC